MTNRGKSSGGSTNSGRNNGKAWKQKPIDPAKRATGRTVGGYSPEKLAIRASKRGKTV